MHYTILAPYFAKYPNPILPKYILPIYSVLAAYFTKYTLPILPSAPLVSPITGPPKFPF